ncbi:MAG TPA: UDP-N-acetylmuramoyl-L-alanine--D-glutamate ligase, partial [Polyangiaceae bacterium]|nr:UDP-N-acetylmuramoyl-L-alanine--D-glutamate ligase [Polyangiaceae bacterium]
MELAERQVAVVGLGESGVAAAELCRARGAKVVGFDEATTIPARDFEVVLGPLADDALLESSLVIVSPGVPDKEAMRRASEAGIEIIGELELASRFLDAPIVLVGGTNGKSTVTAWTAAMLEASGKRVFCGG